MEMDAYTSTAEPDAGTALYRRDTRLMWVTHTDPYLTPWFFTPWLPSSYSYGVLPALDCVEFV